MLQDVRSRQVRSATALYQRLRVSIQTKRWQWAAGMLIGIALYSYIGLRLWRDWSTFDLTALQFRFQFLAVSWLAHSAGTLLVIWAWMLLLRQLGRPLPFKRHLRVYTVTTVTRHLPGFVWWLVGRAYMYDHNGIDKRETLAASVLETVLLATASLSVVAISMAFPGMGLRYMSPFALIVLLACFAGLLHPRLIEAVWRRVHVSTSVPALSWRKMLQIFAYEVVVIALGGITLFLMLAAIYPIRPAGVVGAIIGWALTIVTGSVLFWLPFDFGLSSGVLAVVLSAYVPTPIALVAVVMWRIWTSICEVLWSILGVAIQAWNKEGEG